MPRIVVVEAGDAELRSLVLQGTRMELLECLRKPGEPGQPGWTVRGLARRLECTTQNVHHHLKLLERKGFARVAGEQELNGLARQFWTTDVERVVAKGSARATPGEAATGLYEPFDAKAWFHAMADLGVLLPSDLLPDLAALVEREATLFRALRAGLLSRLGQRGVGVPDSERAVRLAAIATMRDEDFQSWIEGLRLLRRAVRHREDDAMSVAVGGLP